MNFDVNNPKYLSLAERIESYKKCKKEIEVCKKALLETEKEVEYWIEKAREKNE